MELEDQKQRKTVCIFHTEQNMFSYKVLSLKTKILSMNKVSRLIHSLFYAV